MAITLDGSNLITSGVINRGTAVASTSGTSIDFTVPIGASRITVMLSGVSINTSDTIIIQLGDSGGFETTGYFAQSAAISGTNTSTIATYTTGFGSASTNAANTNTGNMIINNVSGNTWIASGVFTGATTNVNYAAGSKTLSDVITQVRITTLLGTTTFDAGSINILYE